MIVISHIDQRIQMNKSLKIHQDECSICLENMETNNFETSCHHYFHRECLSLWKETTCPICRKYLLTEYYFNFEKSNFQPYFERET